MTSFPRVRVLQLLAGLLLLTLLPTATFAQGQSYSGKVVQTFENCGITQVFGVVYDESGKPQPGVKIRLWWGDGEFRTTAGTYVRDTTNESGWDFTLNNHPVANTWSVAAEDSSGNLIAAPVQVKTDGHCDKGAANAVKVEFRKGGTVAAPAPSNPAPNNPAPAAPAPSTEAAPPITAGASCLWYTQTAGGSGGFSVCDDANAKFRAAFQRYGLQNVGYPISQRFKRDGFITQAFQKGVFQWRPDSNSVAFVNVFDELHSRGFDDKLKESRQTPFQLPEGWDGAVSFAQAVAKRQGLLNTRPALRRAYFAASDPMTFFGLPTSDVQDMGNHYAVRLQRAVLQEWKEDVPWARRGQVTIANGGDIAKELGHLPASALTPESSPPTGASQPAPAAPAPAPAAPAPGVATAGFKYGIQAHMIYIDRSSVYAGTKGLGFNWIKQQIEWKAWEGSPGAINWGEMDGVVDGANANGITMLFSVVGAPGWAREPGYAANVAGPPADPQTFANFVGAIAGRYCNKGVGAIEVWNEQNLHYEWGNKALNPADYMALLKPAYASIKAACPSMIVVSGALTPAGNVGNLAVDDFTYLEGMFQHGLAQYADAIGAHPSGYNVPPSMDHNQACAYLRQKGASFMGPCNTPHHSWSFKSTVDGYYAMMQKYGAGSKKIWATEFGWAAGGAFHPDYAYANDNSLQEQAQWTVEAYQYMKNSGKVGAAFLWNLNFRMIADKTEKAQWGILANNGQPLPAYQSLQAMPK